MTHDYKRNGTAALFAALNLLDGTVLGQVHLHHRHQEFLSFLRKPGLGAVEGLDLTLFIHQEEPVGTKWRWKRDGAQVQALQLHSRDRLDRSSGALPA